MFQKQNIKIKEDEISFEIKGDIKISLKCNDPPYASLLTLLHENTAIYEVTVTFESSESLKELMSQSQCTQNSLIGLLETLHLNNFAHELNKKIKGSNQPGMH